MFTRDEIVYAFTPVTKLDEAQKMKHLRIQKSFEELATDIADLVPVCSDRTAALRKILEAKWTCVQAITHYKEKVPAKETANAKKENTDTIQKSQ